MSDHRTGLIRETLSPTWMVTEPPELMPCVSPCAEMTDLAPKLTESPATNSIVPLTFWAELA